MNNGRVKWPWGEVIATIVIATILWYAADALLQGVIAL